MSGYEQYITAVNKIFDYLAKMRAGWNSQDNISYIESIEEYKQTVIQHVDTFKNVAAQPQVTNNTEAGTEKATENVPEEQTPAGAANTQEVGALGND